MTIYEDQKDYFESDWPAHVKNTFYKTQEILNVTEVGQARKVTPAASWRLAENIDESAEDNSP
jgi:hypothetical protein